MRIVLRWRGQAPSSDEATYLLEVVAPRTNTAALSSAENLFASLALSAPVCVELAADCERRRFLVRTSSPQVRQQLMSQISAAYPQAELRPLSARDDPGRVRADEQIAACTLALRAPDYLPLRTFTDLDVDGERAAQADPVLGILSALGDVPAGWRGLSQILLQLAPEDWCRGYQRLAVQHPLEHERVGGRDATVRPLLGFTVAILIGLLVGLQAYGLWRSAQWLQLGTLVFASVVCLAVTIVLIRRLSAPRMYDMDLVREKVARPAFRAEVRLVVCAPAESSPPAVEEQLQRIAAAYRRFNLAAANGFVVRRTRPKRALPRLAVPWRSRRAMGVLTTLELAGLWHLPHAAADVALLERTTARRWLPLPPAVAAGCRIGVSSHQGHQVPVSIPADVLRRHILLVAKTRRGKSTLMQRLAHYAMECEPRRAVLLVDPHTDLAEAVLSSVPPARVADVVYLDVANSARPFGLNLLDTGLGWERDRAVSNALTIFQREWTERFWGPRMEDAFRFALMGLFEANATMCTADPVHGRYAQYTLLDVPGILSDAAFRREVLSDVRDAGVRAWWSRYFDTLERRYQLEIVNPVLTKIHRFEGSTAAKYIACQPASTIDPTAWLREGKIIVVNTARGTVGESAAALIGSTIINLMTLVIAEQARLNASVRSPVSMFVDEFHTIPGADYEGILAELSKYGANLVLATQSLARLLALGGDDGRALRATVFANLDGLFAFNCSAEDADYLVAELGGALDEQDLIELGEHQCYVRLSSRGERLPTFSVQLDPPLSGDAEQGLALAQASAERYGRDAEDVANDLQSSIARLLDARAKYVQVAQSAAEPAPTKGRARNEHRPRKKRSAAPTEEAVHV